MGLEVLEAGLHGVGAWGAEGEAGREEMGLVLGITGEGLGGGMRQGGTGKAEGEGVRGRHTQHGLP